MSASIRSYTSSVQLVGLGGAGANILETFTRNKTGLIRLLKREGIRISLLALDVADYDVKSLETAYKGLSDALKDESIPSDKINLIAKTVKFPTPETMFDFIRRYPQFLKRERVKTPTQYRPWLSSSTEIPPLAGGVGRKRALSKAIYGLNYHHLKLVDNYIDAFKEHVFSSTVQPVIFIIFALGGGSGSGMILDFARHLRRKVGSGIPLVGLCILPCSGDDPPAKGSSAYASILEHELVIDRERNAFVSSQFGQGYENPFTAFLMMPLGPAYSRAGSLVDSWKLIDEAIVDVLMKSLNFDLADLFSNIGSNVDLGGNWVHVLSTLKVSYPVQDFIKTTKIYLDKLDKMRELRREKLEICYGTAAGGEGGLLKLLQTCNSDLREVYRRLLIAKGTYDEEKFDNAVATLISEDRSIESEFIMHLRGVNESNKHVVNDLAKSVLAIGLDAPEGTVESRIRMLTGRFIESASDLPVKYSEFESRAEDLMDDLRSSIPSAQSLTPKQIQLVNDVIDLAKLTSGYLRALRLYLETNFLADKLSRQLAQLDSSSGDLQRVKRIANPELVIIFSLITSLFTPIATELKTLESRLSDCRTVRRVLDKDSEKPRGELESLEVKKRSKESQLEKMVKELRSMRFSFLAAGKKRFFETKKSELEHDVNIARARYEEEQRELDKIQFKVGEYSDIQRKFEVNSEYRRLVAEINVLSNAYYEQMSNVMRDRGFYDRVAELTEGEQLKIMQRILKEEESLTRENMLKEIIDKRHLKEYLVSALSIFRIPGTLGLTAEYKSDYLWFTVVTPRGIWDSDLESEVRTILSGYVKEDASKSIYTREVDSDDPWTLRFLIIAAKARPEHLEAFEEMGLIYDKTTPGEKILSHSFLLEQGIHVSPKGELTPYKVYGENEGVGEAEE